MGIDNQYKDQTLSSVDEVIALCQRLVSLDSLDAALLLNDHRHHGIEFSSARMPAFMSSLDEYGCESFHITGKVKSRDDYLRIMTEHWDTDFLPNDWILSFSVYFLEKESGQAKDSGEIGNITCRDGKVYFRYSANGDSKLKLDETYRVKTLNEIIEALALPVRLEITPEKYTFVHTVGGFAEGSGGDFVPKPSGFKVELLDQSPEDLARRLRVLVERFSDGRNDRFNWSVDYVGYTDGKKLDPQELRAVKQKIVEKGIKADKYTIHTSIAINSYEALKNVFAAFPKSKLEIDLIQIIMENEPVNISLISNKKGFYLRARTPLYLDISEFNKRLGTHFTQA